MRISPVTSRSRKRTGIARRPLLRRPPIAAAGTLRPAVLPLAGRSSGASMFKSAGSWPRAPHRPSPRWRQRPLTQESLCSLPRRGPGVVHLPSDKTLHRALAGNHREQPIEGIYGVADGHIAALGVA